MPGRFTSSSSSVRGIILSHVDEYQRTNHDYESFFSRQRLSNKDPSSEHIHSIMNKRHTDATAAVIKLKEALINMDSTRDDDQNKSSLEEFQQDVTTTVLHIMQASFATMISSNASSTKVTSSNESVSRVLDFVAAFAFSDGDGSLALHISDEVQKLSCVEVEAVRVQFCEFLGMCLACALGEFKSNVCSVQSNEHRTRVMKYGEPAKISFLMSSLLSAETHVYQDDKAKNCIHAIAALIQPRLTDKSQTVRSAAIEACYFLFHPERHTDTIATVYEDLLETIVFNVSHDTSVNNRCKALSCIPILPETMPIVIERLRDAKEKVRVLALNILRTKSSSNDLTPEQRSDILRHGLTERCHATYEASVKLLCRWMKEMKFDPICTLRLLEPDSNETVCETVVKAIVGLCSDNYVVPMELEPDIICEDFSSNETRSMKERVLKAYSIDSNESDGDLDSSKAIYIRVMYDLTSKSHKLSEVQKSTHLSKMVPDVTVLCDVLIKSVEKLKQIQSRQEDSFAYDHSMSACSEVDENAECFVCLQLLRLGQQVDLKEEGSRRHFASIINQMLCSEDTYADLITECINVMTLLHDSESHFLQSLSEVLADTLDDENSDGMKHASGRSERYLRSIEILSIALEKIGRQVSSNPIFQNFSDVILTSITDTSLGPLVRESAVSCLARYVILLNECDIIDKFKPLLMEVAMCKSEKVEIRAQALLALCDLCLLHERLLAPTVLSRGDGEEVTISFSSLLLQIFNGGGNALTTIAAECAAKLHYAGRIYDANILAHLFVVYLDPDFVASSISEVGEEVKEVGSSIRLQQLLAIFFPAYSISSRAARMTLLASTKPLLELIGDRIGENKRKKSFVWPISRIVEYICQTVDHGEQIDEKEKTHDIGTDDDINSTLEVSVVIGNYLVCKSDEIATSYVRSLCKILSNVELTQGDKRYSILMRELKDDLEELQMIVADEISIGYLDGLLECLKDKIDNEDSIISNMGEVEDLVVQCRISTQRTDQENTSDASDEGSEISSNLSVKRDSRKNSSVVRTSKQLTGGHRAALHRNESVFESIGEQSSREPRVSRPKSTSSRCSRDHQNVPSFASICDKSESRDQKRKKREAKLSDLTFQSDSTENNTPSTPMISKKRLSKRKDVTPLHKVRTPLRARRDTFDD